MASVEPGLAAATAPAEDPIEGAYIEKGDGLVQNERPVAPDQFDEHYETSRLEIWYARHHR